MGSWTVISVVSVGCAAHTRAASSALVKGIARACLQIALSRMQGQPLATMGGAWLPFLNRRSICGYLLSLGPWPRVLSSITHDLDVRSMRMQSMFQAAPSGPSSRLWRVNDTRQQCRGAENIHSVSIEPLMGVVSFVAVGVSVSLWAVH